MQEKIEQAIVIGTSSGGLAALTTLLSPLPKGFRWPIMLVQHRLPTPDDHLTPLLDQATACHVKEAQDKEPLRGGYVYVAPANYHLLVELSQTLALSVDPKVCYARPSIDVLFETAAETFQERLVGILLTGANHDGTAGFRKIKQHNGLTIAQDPTTAAVPLMPQTALEAGVVDRVLSLPAIAVWLSRLG